MTENENDENIEEIVNSFELTMKKGFVSVLILLVLEEEPSHGYKIQKEIAKRSLGYWQPTSSNIYPLLESLKEKKLINCIEQNDFGRQKKVYKITPKGTKTLKMLFRKHQLMIESIKTIILRTMGITDESNPSFLRHLDIVIGPPEMGLIIEGSIESKIDNLKHYRELMLQQIKFMRKNVEKISNILLRLEKDVEHDEVSEVTSHL
ncbi:MAG: PadR family transcriptional regulator [Candidatus Hermodarchaeota archaeon]